MSCCSCVSCSPQRSGRRDEAISASAGKSDERDHGGLHGVAAGGFKRYVQWRVADPKHEINETGDVTTISPIVNGIVFYNNENFLCFAPLG